MKRSAAIRSSDSAAALAVLLSAVARGADGIQGAQQWDSLVTLVGSPGADGPSGEAAGVPELSALRRQSDDTRLAEKLARVLLIRARSDPQFGRALGDWRRRKGIRALVRSIATSPAANVGAGQAALAAASAGGASATPANRLPAHGDGTEHQPGGATAPKPWYRRMAVWVGTAVATPVIVATIVQLETGFIGKHNDSLSPSAVLSPAAPVSVAASPPAAGSALPASAPNSPARVETVTPLNTEPEETYAAADKIQLTAAQLAELNADARSGRAAAVGFLSSIHAVPVGSAFTNVTVTGNEKATVTISDLQVVKHCQAALTGTLFFNPSQGINGTIGIGFDLDSPIYYARAYEYTFRGGDFFRSSIVTLAPGEAQTFDIAVRASLSYCQFTFEMTVATPNGMVTENIDDNGKPFELTGEAKGSFAAEYVGGIEAMSTPTLDDPEGNFVQVDPKTFHAG